MVDAGQVQVVVGPPDVHIAAGIDAIALPVTHSPIYMAIMHAHVVNMQASVHRPLYMAARQTYGCMKASAQADGVHISFDILLTQGCCTRV